MESTEKLEDKVIIVTGATSGIGRATALLLAEEGASVVAVGRNSERLEEVLEEMRKISQYTSSSFDALSLDVTKEPDMIAMGDKVVERFGRIDGLVACAGLGSSPSSSSLLPVSTSKLSLDEWNDLILVNLTGVFLSNRAVIPIMTLQKSGTIINISSYPAGIKGQPYAPAYSASKFGVVGFSESLAEELKRFGIKVYPFLPGLTDTPMVSGSALGNRFGKALNPELVAETIVYMLSLPSDTFIEHPTIFPVKVRKRKKKQ